MDQRLILDLRTGTASATVAYTASGPARGAVMGYETRDSTSGWKCPPRPVPPKGARLRRGQAMR
ncbi:hypothetical protein [Streptosporangium roseum]|uniref:hypothetical protein n=1 Tax=Streptosporangium roseum TaxID=2001 RepID=UPI0031EEE003